MYVYYVNVTFSKVPVEMKVKSILTIYIHYTYTYIIHTLAVHKTFYFDDEAELLFLDVIQKKAVNASAWIKERLKESKAKELDSEYILQKIQLTEHQIDNLQKEKESLKDQLKRAEKQLKEQTLAKAFVVKAEFEIDYVKELDKKTRIVMMELERVKHPQWNDEVFAKLLATEFIEHEKEYPHVRAFLQKKQVIEVKVK